MLHEPWQKRKLSFLKNFRKSDDMFMFWRSGNVKVWTGTFGVLSYPDVNNNDADIYVYVKGDLKLVPAPKYYWKVLQGDDGKFAGFVGLNDPHSPDIAAEDAFCNSVCNEIHG